MLFSPINTGYLEYTPQNQRNSTFGWKHNNADKYLKWRDAHHLMFVVVQFASRSIVRCQWVVNDLPGLIVHSSRVAKRSRTTTTTNHIFNDTTGWNTTNHTYRLHVFVCLVIAREENLYIYMVLQKKKIFSTDLRISTSPGYDINTHKTQWAAHTNKQPE